MFLLGPPGPERLRLAMAFCSVLGREAEVLHISRDTTESDLKLRRELRGASSEYTAQAPLRAALGGRVLVLDGIHRAERNVLPTLNNLLENREMTLDDGSSVISPSAYDRLLAAGATAQSLSAEGIFRVHPAFRVIALGSPVPPYPGKPLDPPLRSRFASRRITPLAGRTQALAEHCSAAAPELRGTASSMVGLLSALHSLEASPASPLVSVGVRLPPVPAGGASALLAAAAQAPADADGAGAASALHRLYPFSLLPTAQVPLSAAAAAGGKGGGASTRDDASTSAGRLAKMAGSIFSPSARAANRAGASGGGGVSAGEGGRPVGVVEGMLRDMGWNPVAVQPRTDKDIIGDTRQWVVPSKSAYHLVSAERTGPWGGVAQLQPADGGAAVAVPVPMAPHTGPFTDAPAPPRQLHLSDALQRTLAAATLDHATGRDVALVAPRGAGKTWLAEQWAHSMGYDPVTFALHADMTARDLLQRRGIDEATGDTEWTDSPLVAAAEAGGAVILDNLQAIPAETLATLQSLCVNRRLDLFDGSRLVPAAEFDSALAAGTITADGVPVASAAVGAGASEAEAAALGRLPVQRLRRVHPSFRIIALGTPPVNKADENALKAAVDAALDTSSRALPSGPDSGSASTRPQTPQASVRSWLSAEVLPMFSFHNLPPCSSNDVLHMLHSTVPHASPAQLQAVVDLAKALKAAAVSQFADDEATAAVLTLSLRQLRRLAARVASAGGATDASAAVHDVMMSAFLPEGARQAVAASIRAAGLGDGDAVAFNRASAAGGMQRGELGGGGPTADRWGLPPSHPALCVGGVSLPVQSHPREPQLVPHPVFFDIPRHVEHLGALARDMCAGERHLLLLGNQGVGKNKLADRLLQALGWEREYIQVHRDSSVASLTLTPSMVQGRVRWEDSPLVQAAAAGRVLMLDEADKAPTEVLAVLKSLLEDGHMLLPDGREIRHLPQHAVWAQRPSLDEVAAALRRQGPEAAAAAESWLPQFAAMSEHPSTANTMEEQAAAWEVLGRAWTAARSIVPLHPNFRTWVLANRPGWPFLGNDFFSAAGDLFAAHVVDNPDMASEMSLLQSYAPGVPEHVLQQLAGAFAELRQQHQDGTLSYPYSTREAVRVARHLAAFPEEDAGQALGDVLAFDAFEPQLHAALQATFAAHGLVVPGAEGGAAGGGDGEGVLGGFGSAGGETRNQLDAKWTLEKVTRDGKTEFEWSPESKSPPGLTSPKHGEEDDAPHVGGSNYAGGSGGSNTAGMGGRGGPYRLDKGHPVHQVPEHLKAEVTAEAQAKAKAMADAALAERLSDIRMSSRDHKEYTGMLQRVGAQVHALRSVLASAEQSGSERVWLRNQSVGDLDDTRLVDGSAGERNIYKRRGVDDSSPFAGDEEQRPAKLHFVFDVSGSMYRFNGADGRLMRSLETALMVMEGFRGQERKYDYCVTGHSGDSPSIPLVPYGAPPPNEARRLEVLQTMVAHSQFTFPGDHTLEAMRDAVRDMARTDAPDGSKYVFVVSDANLRRYGIPVSSLARVATGDPSVKCFVIFIASIGDEAKQIVQALPPGKGFACMDTEQLPGVFQRIFSTQFSK